MSNQTGPIVGIRREDKNRWERRAPLTPDQVASLIRKDRIGFRVQPSDLRVFPDQEYTSAGAEVNEDLTDCGLVLGVKEMPRDFFRQDGAYMFFSHVIKGQAYNMPMLERMMRLGCSLIDYEKILDDEGRRLVFFGRFAGIAGMLDTLSALGQRLKMEGLETALTEVKLAHEYEHVQAALEHLREIGHRVRHDGVPEALRPLVIGIAGYGHVASGAVEVLEALGTLEVSPDDPAGLRPDACAINHAVFKEQHMVEPADETNEFDLLEYYEHPDRYRPVFARVLPHLTALANCIYWEKRYPRLVTRQWLRDESADPAGLRMRVIGDISCDVGGAIEVTARTTDPGNPFYTYDPSDDRYLDGVRQRGVTILAVDNLPCELPVDSSHEFGESLIPYVAKIARADFGQDITRLDLPPPIRRGLILHRGELTSEFEYIADFLKSERSRSR